VKMLRNLLRSRRGATAVEHALILPVFFLLTLVMIEAAWQMAIAAGVDHGARRGARWISLGAAAPTGMTRDERLAEIVLTSTGLPLNAGRLVVTPTAFSSFAQLGTPGAGMAGLGGPDQVVHYVITYQSTLLTPPARSLIPAGLLRFRTVIVAQNEPFPQ